MALTIFNTLTRKKEEFKPIKSPVTIYSCGPTTYSYVHIGNLRAMVCYDFLKRYLKYKGFKVRHVMNITDIDDKTIKGARKENKSLKEFTEFYTKEFLADLKTIAISNPDIMPKATQEIDGMVKLIKTLLDKKIAYKTDNGDIYFSISKFKDYGKLASLDLETLKQNADGRLNNSDEYTKEDARDFALWKAYDKDDGTVFWDTEISKGRPGWHIECSAMSAKYLGQPFDIHMGGIDLVFPHHTNEIAQSEAATGKKFCNYWVHNEHLLVNGEKMSKSKGNFYTLRDLLKRGYDPMAIKLELLSTHYRQQLDFKERSLPAQKQALLRINELLIKLDEVKNDKDNPAVEKLISSAKLSFEKALDDDLNISGALSTLFNFVRDINKIVENISKKDAKKLKETIFLFDTVLAIIDYKKEDIPKGIIELAKKRLVAKKAKDYTKADSLREEIKSKGYSLDDSKEGYIIKKIN